MKNLKMELESELEKVKVPSINLDRMTAEKKHLRYAKKKRKYECLSALLLAGILIGTASITVEAAVLINKYIIQTNFGWAVGDGAETIKREGDSSDITFIIEKDSEISGENVTETQEYASYSESKEIRKNWDSWSEAKEAFGEQLVCFIFPIKDSQEQVQISTSSIENDLISVHAIYNFDDEKIEIRSEYFYACENYSVEMGYRGDIVASEEYVSKTGDTYLLEEVESWDGFGTKIYAVVSMEKSVTNIVFDNYTMNEVKNMLDEITR